MLWVDSTAPNYEGKGAVAGRICRDLASWHAPDPVVGVRVGGPNAGHTVMGVCPPDCGEAHPEALLRSSTPHPWRLRQVPVAAVAAPDAQLVIAAGSEVDPEVLRAELADLDAAGYSATGRLVVDRSATVLHSGYRKDEEASSLGRRLGSTAKGIGAARADRIWRGADVWGDLGTTALFGRVADTAELLYDAVRGGQSVVVEGTQGYGLGLHTANYPFTTSGDCRAIDFLAQAGLSPWQLDGAGWETGLKVVVCLRPHPIRVAGNSGPLKGETGWSELGLPVEYTTVTKKVRRVGEWDPALAAAAVRANGGPRAGVVWVALTMMDSVDPGLSGEDGRIAGHVGRGVPSTTLSYLDSIGLDARHLGYVGTGPDSALVNERMYH